MPKKRRVHYPRAASLPRQCLGCGDTGRTLRTILVQHGPGFRNLPEYCHCDAGQRAMADDRQKRLDAAARPHQIRRL